MANPVGGLYADSSSNLTRIFSLYNYIHATGVAILSAKGLGTMTKNNLLGIAPAFVLDQLSPFMLSREHDRSCVRSCSPDSPRFKIFLTLTKKMIHLSVCM